MISFPRCTLALLLTAPAAAVSPGSAGAGTLGNLTPTHLRCEYAENPIGIDEAAPRLSWRLESSARGAMQSAYQVLAASSRELLGQGRGDLWDSGVVRSGRNTQVEYRGRALGSGERAFWKVKVWDAGGRPSRCTAPGYWETGLLRRSDWDRSRWIGIPAPPQSVGSMAGAKWVWYPEGSPARNAPAGPRFFRKRLDLPADRKVSRARIWLAVDNDFLLAVNGKEVGRGGGWGSAQEFEITPRLDPGANVLAVTAVNASPGPAGLLGRYRIDFERGEPLTGDIDGGWKASRQAPPGWDRGAFDDASWPAAQEMGAMGMAPWGQVSVATQPDPAVYLRKEFTPRKPVARARAYVTALGVYQLYLNGRRAGDQVLAPGWTDYRKRAQYQTYDVTGLLRRGGNALAAVVGDGWYAGALGWALQRSNFGPPPTRFRMQLALTYRDGTTETVATDGRWKGGRGPILESDLYGGETYDARREVPGWDQPGFSGAADRWQAATVYNDLNPELDAQTGPPIRITEELPTREITQPKPGVYVFDLGQNMVGFARLKVRGPTGTQVTLRYAEVLNPDGTVYRENLRRARATDVYTLSGRGEEVFQPHFTYHGFRYVEVTGFPGAPSRGAITGLVFHSDMPFTSRFATSSGLVNRLYRNISWGQRANLMSVPTDCPQRDERLGWMGDANLFARTSCWYMEMPAFYSKWMRDIIDAQSPEGFFSDVSPRVVDPSDGAPAWADAGVVIPWTVYECYGDTRILERSYPAVKKYVDLLVRENPNLLWLKRRNNDFGDWVAAGEQTDKDLIASAFLAWDLRALSRMAEALGKRDDAGKYAKMADLSRTAFNRRFLAPDGRYLGDTQSAYAIAFGMGLAPDDRRAEVGRRLVESVERRGVTLATGFIGTRFLLPALSRIGRDDLAYRLLLNTKYPSWGYMIEHGATTMWELWNSDKAGPGMNSRNHFAFGSVAEWMQRYLAGIDTSPDAPGYRRIVIHPHLPPAPESIDRAAASYDSVQGIITSEWSLGTDGLRLKVTVPANTTAAVYVPGGAQRGRQVSEGGRTVARDGRYIPGAAGFTSGRAEGTDAVFEVGGGTYVFRVRDTSRQP